MIDVNISSMKFACWDEINSAQSWKPYYSRLYGPTRDELRYIFDPKEVYGEDFPREIYRVLKEKEVRQFGEYRTRRLVLEAWDALEGTPVSRVPMPAMPTPAPVQPSTTVKEPQSTPNVPAIESAPVRNEPKPVEENSALPMLSDFGLYKCGQCEKLVTGYEKEKYEKAATQASRWSGGG